MTMIELLILVPLIPAICIIVFGSKKTFAPIIYISSIVIIALSIVSVNILRNSYGILAASDIPYTNYIILFLEISMALYIIKEGIVRRYFLVSIMAFMQVVSMFVYEHFYSHDVIVGESFYVDPLTAVMVLIIGIIGSLICIYAVKYMNDYHEHHPEVKDRRKLFFTVFFVFLSAMFGVVLSNHFSKLLFFWEITSLCSFILIGYSRSEQAIKNSFLALTINVFGGLLFTIGIILLGIYKGVGDFRGLYALEKGDILVSFSVFFIAIAGLTKSAQMPFSRWLLGAMVAPTPVSALLHSSTMVKAGVYLIIRLAPVLGKGSVGMTISTVGGLTFFIAAVIAVSQSDSKKVLAYSTISNLGLIVACAAINTPEALWAAVMLIIFHAVAKSLLFLTVGSAEHQLGSRDVEVMDGFYNISPKLASFMIIGIMGMFIAPFGMLISKWAVMKAFSDYNNVLMLVLLAFGSTITFFFWTKWLGKIIANARLIKESNYKIGISEDVTLCSLAFSVIGVCLIYPLIGKYFIFPFVVINMLYSLDLTYMLDSALVAITSLDTALLFLMMFLIFSLIFVLRVFYKSPNIDSTAVYMAGENTGDNMSYNGSIGQTVKVELKNWYMENLFGEGLWLYKSQVLALSVLLIGSCAILGGM